jgi:EAL domain-containing protein (putative c-di-GMP-specific phosphodiesterase class I)
MHESPSPPAATTRVTADPQGVFLYSTLPAAFVRLKAVLDLHRLSSTEPLPYTQLIIREPGVLSAALSQWRDGLTSAEVDCVRGVLLSSATPSQPDLAQAILQLTPLDTLLAQMQGRWLPRLMQSSESFFSMFQPLVSTSTRQTKAYECLIRGRDAGGTIPAGKLLGAARVMGMVHELDTAAWRSAIQRGAALARQGHQLFVNFTPSSIADLKFGLQEAVAHCKEHGVPFQQLVFEVTEGEQISDIGQLERIVSEYRAEGAKVALDDLGSGYSSILHLADLLPDYVKLDQGLVRGAHQDYVRSVLLKAITDAAHELGILVVAEGVETEDDLKFCIAIDADLVQGYFLARPAETPQPVSLEALETLASWVRDVKT